MKTIRPPRNYYNSYLPFHEKNFKTCISYDVFMFFVNIIFKNVKKNNFSCTVYYQITRKNRINFHFQVIQRIWILGIKIFFLLNKYFFILFLNLFIYFIHKLLHKSFGNYIKFIFVAVNKMFLPYNIEIKQKKKTINGSETLLKFAPSWFLRVSAFCIHFSDYLQLETIYWQPSADLIYILIFFMKHLL